MNNIFTSSFTAPELQKWLREFEPEGFNLEIYGQKDQQFGISRQSNTDIRVWSVYGMRGESGAIRNNEPLCLFDRCDYRVYEGDENIYISFNIESEDNLYYAHWGYKMYEVEGDKMLELVTLIHKTISNKEIKP